MEVGKAIYTLVSTDAAVVAIAGTRVFPERAEIDTPQPFVAYTVTNQAPTRMKNSSSTLDVADVELYCVAKDYAEAIDLGVAVRNILDRNGGTIAGVEVQSINYEGSDVDFFDEREIYVVTQRYNVRVQRVGQAPAVTLIGVASALTIKEVDGSPIGAVSALILPNGSLTIASGEATLSLLTATDLRYTATKWQYVQAIMSASVLSGGASAEDYGAATLRAAKFDTNYDQVGADLTFAGQANSITIGVQAYYRVTCSVTFTSGTNISAPYMHVAIDGVAQVGEGHAFTYGSSAVDRATAHLTWTKRLAEGAVLTIEVADSSDVAGTIFATAGIWEVERVH